MFHRKTSRRLLHLALGVTLIGLLLAPGAGLNKSSVKVPGTVAHATTSKSYVDFITSAYLGAYGRYPDCSSELEPEFYNLAYAHYLGSTQFQAEATRFVATLFETQASYDDPNYSFSGLYVQTSEYEALNAHNSSAEEAFVTDLYQAYLQREPDSSGLAFWTDDVISEGRKKGIAAFDFCGEFEDLVSNLYQGDAPDCGGGGCQITCEPGQTLNQENCTCEQCGGPHQPLCDIN